MQMTRKEEEKLLEDIMFIDSQQLQILQAKPTSSILPVAPTQRHLGTGPWLLDNSLT